MRGTLCDLTPADRNHGWHASLSTEDSTKCHYESTDSGAPPPTPRKCLPPILGAAKDAVAHPSRDLDRGEAITCEASRIKSSRRR